MSDATEPRAMPRVWSVGEALAAAVAGTAVLMAGTAALAVACAETPEQAQARHRADCARRGGELVAVMAGPQGDAAVCRPAWGGR